MSDIAVPSLPAVLTFAASAVQIGQTPRQIQVTATRMRRRTAT